MDDLEQLLECVRNIKKEAEFMLEAGDIQSSTPEVSNARRFLLLSQLVLYLARELEEHDTQIDDHSRTIRRINNRVRGSR
jgi:hypothetical protein